MESWNITHKRKKRRWLKNVEQKHRETQSSIKFRNRYRADQFKYAEKHSYSRALQITQYFHEHGQVYKKDKGFVFMLNGDL